MINTLTMIVTFALIVVGFVISFLRLLNSKSKKDESFTIELMILFSGLSLTLWNLSYFGILIATLGALGVILETKNK
ncbi:putative nucleic acid-binding Zn ribbon protein [Weissella beninensis]|uniref:Uncharacterized protein n=1 Tax=Periweissella beninensis TaxID=504936 RepID=A0ABT0VJF9_9LACO|nr:hypothetical protein [Periweissella beninensis]MBM7544952.1 putative nucleic acid-binding Zn ribbon protein [Periweissella beninensis]MCM2437970.1 hypothetical protein [Periweissella beninensis]